MQCNWRTATVDCLCWNLQNSISKWYDGGLSMSCDSSGMKVQNESIQVQSEECLCFINITSGNVDILYHKSHRSCSIFTTYTRNNTDWKGSRRRLLFILSNFRNSILFSYLHLASSFSPLFLYFSFLSRSFSFSSSCALYLWNTTLLLLLLPMLNPFESMRIQPDSRYDCGTDTLDLGAIGFCGAVFFFHMTKTRAFLFYDFMRSLYFDTF